MAGRTDPELLQDFRGSSSSGDEKQDGADMVKEAEQPLVEIAGLPSPRQTELRRSISLSGSDA